MGTSIPKPSITLDTAPQRAVSAHLPDFHKAQRLDAFRTLEGTKVKGRMSQGSGDGSNGEERPITMCGKRLYSDWAGYWDGAPRKILGAGTLFPEGYLPRIGDPYPWICPVRDCQTIFPEAWALGGHFSVSHRACLLNDNLDGTMSVVGRRKTADPISGRMPPMVVSRNGIDPATAPPRAMPRRPERKRSIDQGTSWPLAPTSLPESRPPAKDEPEKNATRSYANCSLFRAKGTCHTGGDSSLPAATQRRTHSVLCGSPSTLPFPECIALPWTASAELKAHFGAAGCCNRFYRFTRGNRNQPYCVSRFSLSSDLGGGAHALPEVSIEKTALSPQPDAVDEGGHNELTDEPDTSTSTFTSISTPPAPSPTATPNYSYNHTYKTAIPVLAAGRPKLVSITKPSRPATSQPTHTTATTTTATHTTMATTPTLSTTTPDVTDTTTAAPIPTAATTKGETTTTKPEATTATKTKTKRHSSIRRLAEKLGAKAAWREAAVYQPRGGVVHEEVEEEMEEGEGGRGGVGKGKGRRMVGRRGGGSGKVEDEKGGEKGGLVMAGVVGSGGDGGSGSGKTRGPRGSVDRNLRDSSSGSGWSASGIGMGSGGGSAGGGSPSTGSSGATSEAGQDKSGATVMTTADWEITPGRICVGTGADAEVIAFSSSYLAQGRPVPITDGTTFQVLEIPASRSVRWSSSDSGTRLCSVARGTVQVWLSDREEFPIGPNGMFKVGVGVACVVVNASQLGAVVHVTMVGVDAV
ncbi:hypothetical protein F5144DRAFT_659403 [Chaetomium tenue]|uniref:Uncharacterized protein n=1 Tax=Chaetomium tenue TaxID=1854479 RepID=A0ACB7P244_9PEZI|nr:hypothetical protein F5144DRAFT_659403 [Chaetomium globosum]